jgi:effector-binding domain-containing protein
MPHAVATVDLPEEHVVAIRERHDPADVAAYLRSSFADLFARLALLGAGPAGPPFVIYHELGPHEIDAEVCVPVDARVTASGRIRSVTVPAMSVARTIHVGPYDQIGPAHLAITDWLEEHDLQPIGPIRERYLVGPGDVIDPRAYRTEVEVPFLPVPAGVLA